MFNIYIGYPSKKEEFIIGKTTTRLDKSEIKYISAGKYSIKIEAQEIKTADNKLREIISEIEQTAKKDGMNIYLETTPHHLFLSESAYVPLGVKAQMNPPLRTEEDQEALWQGINDGTIDTIGTDHAPHTLEEKNQKYGKDN